MSIAVVLSSGLMDGAGDSIKRDSEATISPINRFSESIYNTTPAKLKKRKGPKGGNNSVG